MIFYFTGTGNSLAVAKWWQKTTKDQMVSIAEMMKKEVLNFDDETLVFCFPVYYYALPHIVEDFIRSVKFTDAKTIVGLINCASFSGLAIKKLTNLLEEKGLSLDYAFGVRMPENYTMVFNPTSKEKSEEIYRETERDLQVFYQRVKEGKKGGYHTMTGPLASLIYHVARPFYERGRKTAKFYAQEHCIGCGICSKVCPIGVIEMRNHRPYWTEERCIHCAGCINQCPVEALQYGRVTKRRRRYVHPDYRMFPEKDK